MGRGLQDSMKGQLTFTNIQIIIGFVITIVLALVLYSLMLKFGDGGTSVPGTPESNLVIFFPFMIKRFRHRS